MRNSISVLGCGWLGLPLALALTNQHYLVKGSTTSSNKLEVLKQYGITPFLIKYPSNEKHEKFFDSKILIINTPPKLRYEDGEQYITQITQILNEVEKSKIERLIFISSTSVYKDLNKEVNEADCTHLSQAGNQVIFEAEEMIRKANKYKPLIIRCAGLTGYDRILIKHFSGKKGVLGGNHPVNLIHRDDVIGILLNLLKNDIHSDTLNICSPEHPTREKFYMDLAERFNYEPPEFSNEKESDFKIIGIKKLISRTDYQFKYPNPLLFSYDLN